MKIYDYHKYKIKYCLTFFLILLIFNVSSQTVVFQEPMTNAWTSCNVPDSWNSSDACGSADAWHRNDVTSNWSFPTGGSPSANGWDGTGNYARFHAYGITSGNFATLITPNINISGYINNSLTFYYINPSGTDNVTVYFSSNGGSTWSASMGNYVVQAGWSQKTIAIPVAYQVTNFQVQFKAISDYGNDDLGIDHVTVTGTVPCTPPTTQASAFTSSNLANTTLTVGWTRGNGNNVMVIARAGSAPTDPTDGTSYTANSAYGSGTAVGGGFCVYNGAGTSVNLTALTANTVYYFAIYEYLTTGTCYNQTQLTGNVKTANNGNNVTHPGNGGTATYYQCSGSYYDPGGLGGSTTDGTANNYPHNIAISTVTFYPAVVGDKVRLVFSVFATENDYDGMMIYNGPNSGYPLFDSGLGDGLDATTCPAGSWRGAGSPATVTSTDASGALTIVFRSDAAVNSTGWVAAISCYSPPYQSLWVSMNAGSANWCQGEVRNVDVTVRNDGSSTWTDAAPEINIGCKWDGELDYYVRVNAGGLAPGAQQLYTLSMTAPAAGAQHLTFDVVNEGDCWFGANSGSCGPGNTVYTSGALTIFATPVAPTLSSANPANGTTICAGYNSGTVTGTGGSGGGTGAANEYRVSTNNGSTWAAYTNGSAITTTGATGNIIVQARRTGGTECSNSAWSTICTWPVGSATVNPTLNIATPASTTLICAGYNGPNATITSGSGGSSGATDTYQYSINNGSTWNAYTSGSTINATGATTNVLIRTSRSAGSYGCNATGPTTIVTWPVNPATVNPALNVATPASGSTLCAGYNGPNATITAGSGGSAGATDTYQYSINNGTGWNAYTSGTTINTTGATTNVLIRTSRSSSGSYGCNATGPTTIVTWPVGSATVAPTLSSATPANGSTICAGFNDGTVTGTGGSGGSSGAANEYQVSTNGGSTWAAYTNSAAITTTGATGSVIVQSRRTAGSYGCSNSAWSTICTWTVGSGSTAPASINASTNPICAGNSTNLTVVGGSLGSGAVWKWGYNACAPVFTQNWNTQPYGLSNTTLNSVNGILTVTSTSNDPMIDMATLGSFDPAIYKYVQFRYRVTSGTAGTAEIFFYNTSHPGAVGGESATGAIVSDGAWHVLNINMASDPEYTTGGNITGWRFDWCSTSAVTMEIDYISLTATQGSPVSVSPTETATYYAYAEGDCGTTTCASLLVTVVPNNGPVALNATGQTSTTFDANWTTFPGATAYYLDVNTNSSFTGTWILNNTNVGLVTTYPVTGLTANTQYFYRVRATTAGCGTTLNSATISTYTRKYLFTVDGDGGQQYTSISAAVADVYTVWGSTAFDNDVTVDVYTYTGSGGDYDEQVAPNTLLNPTSAGKLVIKAADGESPVINAASQAYGIYINNIDFVKVLGFSVYAATTANIYAVGSQNEIAYNKCYSSSAGSGILLENSTTQSGIHHNLCYNNFIHGIHSKNNTNTIVKNNTCYSNGNIGTGSSGNYTPSYTTPSVAINDGTCDATFAEASLAQAGTGVITDVNVTITTLTHTFDGDMKIYLRHPDGTDILLSNRRGSSGDDFTSTVFDDEAGTAIASGASPFTGSFIPDASLSALDGKAANGTWKLRITDCAGSDVGTITAWSLNIAYTIPSSSNSGSGLYVESGAGSIVTNNIFVAKSATGDYFYGLFSVPAIATTSGFNTYFANGNTNFVKHNGTSYSVLATWNGTSEGNSDLNGDPLFVTSGSDFHIKSMAGSYHGGSWPPSNYLGGTWTYDASNSPCIDAGNSSDGVGSEPSPNGSLVNQGAYGGTTHASKTTLPPTIDAVAGGSSVTLYKDRGKQIIINGSNLVSPSATLGGISGTLVSFNFSSATFDFPPGTYPNNNLIVTNSAGSSATDNTNVTIATRNIIPVKQSGAIPDDHPTILSAVNGLKAWWGTAAFDADKTISVYNGVYDEGLDVDYNFNPGSFRLIFQGTTGRPVIDASTQSVGLYIHDGVTAVDNVTIKGFEVKNATTGGIGIIGGNDSIYNNVVYNCGTYNIYKSGTTSGSLIAYNKCYNTITTKYGITVSASANVTIKNNLCYGHTEHGIWLDGGANNNCTIINNTCYNNGSSATTGGTPGSTAPTSGAISVAIPDVGCPTYTTSTLNVATVATITDVNIKLNITHTWDGDLTLYLRHPDGTQVSLCLNRGGSGPNFVNTWFDDEAGTAISAGAAPFTGSYTPETPLTQFDNKPTNGVWTLQVCDGAGGDVGTITQWEMLISYVTAGGTTYTGTGLYVQNGTTALVKNNILVAKSGTGDQYYAMRADVAINSGSGYNTYNKNGNTNFVKHTSTNYSDSATWNGTAVGNNDWMGDPQFVNTTSGSEDFHEKSTANSSTYTGGSWPPFTESGGSWDSYPGFYSHCIDAGDPASAYSNEQSYNGARINQGCFGNTVQATRSCLITVAAAGPDQNPACPNPSITLAGNTPAYGTGLWTVTGGTGIFANNTVPATTVTGLAQNANTYTWTISNNGCTSSDNVVITNLMPAPIANAGPDQLITSGTSATLAGNPATAGTGTWSVVTGAGTFVNANLATTVVNSLGSGLNTLRWSITNGGTCPSTTDDVDILVAPNHTGVMITGDVTNNGTIVQEITDTNRIDLIGHTKSLLGTGGLYTNVKLKIHPLAFAAPVFYYDAVSMTGNPKTYVSNGKFEIKTGRTFKTGDILIAGSNTLSFTTGSIVECTGDWRNNGTMLFADATPVVKFNGTGNIQTIRLNSATNEFKNIVFDNKTGGNIPGRFTLEDSLVIAGNATFTYGFVRTYASPAVANVVFKDDATASGYNDNSFVRGKVRKWGNENFTFPVGFLRGTVNACNPITIDNSAGAAGDWYMAEYVRKWSTGLGLPSVYTDTILGGINVAGYISVFMDAGSQLDHVSRQEFWEVSKKSAASYRPVTLYTNNMSFSGIEQANIAEIQVAHYKTSNSKWENMNSNTPFVITDPTGNGKGYVTSNVAFSSYSPVTFGSKTGSNPLPTVMKSFTARCNNSNIQLEWVTSSEINNSHFIIEKSYDGDLWFDVAKVSGNGNSNIERTYKYFDKLELYNKTVYYRLIQMDFNNEKTEYNAVSATCYDNLISESYIIYPNPAKEALYISIQSAKQISGMLTLTNELGQKIDIVNLELVKGNNEVILNTSGYAAGMYYISIVSENNTFPVKRFVISE